MTQAELEKKIESLERQLGDLKRISQEAIRPDTIKMRHIGEGVRYVQTGLAADRPETPAEPPNSCMIYFAYDANVLSVWNTSTNAWKTTTLS